MLSLHVAFILSFCQSFIMLRMCWHFIKAGGISVPCVRPLFKKKKSKHSFYCSTTHKEKLEKNGSGTAWASKNQFTKVAVTSLYTYWLV